MWWYPKRKVAYLILNYIGAIKNPLKDTSLLHRISQSPDFEAPEFGQESLFPKYKKEEIGSGGT